MRIHESAVVDAGAKIGEGTHVWHFCHVMGGARLGVDCMLGQNCFVGRGVQIGDRVRIQNNVSVYEGVILEDDVFCGPSVVFTNVKNPRVEVDRKAEFLLTTVRRGATLGANATLLPGVTVGAFGFVGAGAVVTRDVAPYALVLGTPARQVGWVSRAGERLEFGANGQARCSRTGEAYRLVGDRVEPA
jgi:UDP-2-acetamido-3-amino-2,3-dideoxy-glucuronate N-acetyltransferase